MVANDLEHRGILYLRLRETYNHILRYFTCLLPLKRIFNRAAVPLTFPFLPTPSENSEMSAVSLWMKGGGDSAMKINVSMTFMAPAEITSATYNIENLVMLRFKGRFEMLEDKMKKISYSYSLSKHKSAKGKTIKINIVNETIKYSAFDINTPDAWSKWQPMGYSTPFVDTEVYHAIAAFLITAYEDKKDAILSKLYTDIDFTDFRLTTPEGSVAVHKAYMAANSEVFKAMLTNEWKETAEGQINIQGATVETLQHLKDYMYLGTLAKDGLRPLLLIARLYLIEDLEKKCIRKLAESVSAEELLSLVQFACDNNIPELVSAMLETTQDSVINKAHELKRKSLDGDHEK